MLLAVAAVATAWSSYQATRWNGEQAKTASRVNKTRIEAARASDLANAQQQVDVATFMQWVDAYARDESELVSFYQERFRAEFKPAFDAWIATKPLVTEGAPLTPFAMPEYRLAARAEAERLDAEAEVLAADGAAGHPARVELRARRRALRGRALLRRDEHEAHRPRAAQGDARRSAASSFSAPLVWIATFPVSVVV